MENLTQIAKQRAERAKRTPYTTPLPFDGLANGQRPTSTTLESSSGAGPRVHQRHVHTLAHHSDNSSHSAQSQISSDLTSSSSGRTSRNTYRQPSPPKHVPLYTLIDFRVSHSLHPISQGLNRPPQDISDTSHAARDPNPSHPPQKRIPHTSVAHNTVPHSHSPNQPPPNPPISLETVDGTPSQAPRTRRPTRPTPSLFPRSKPK